MDALDKMRPDIMVLGTGRSGTSFAGEILHNHFDACMGDVNKFYECRVMFKPSIQLCARFGGVFTGTVPTIEVESWLEQFDAFHRQCDCGKPFCGLKVTHLSWMTTEQLLYIRPRLIVRTWRNAEDTAMSFRRRARRGMKKFNLETWHAIIASAESNLERLEKETKGLVQFVRINIPAKSEPRLPRDVAIKLLEPYIEKLRCDQM
jgi:hypothetical protein